MYIAGVPTIEFEECILLVRPLYRDVYHRCANCRMRVQECILLVRPPYNASLGMYIAGATTVGYEPWDIYRWCAYSRM